MNPSIKEILQVVSVFTVLAASINILVLPFYTALVITIFQSIVLLTINLIEYKINES